MPVVIDDGRHKSQMDRTQLADQTKYAPGGMTMKEVSGGILSYSGDDELAMKMCGRYDWEATCEGVPSALHA